jgi:glycosyltransferase involved in cell wall biosynthesis
LAQGGDVQIRVFFTWHAGQESIQDRGFGIPVAWDIPLTQGYDYELVPNVAADPGTHHFFGLRNPQLVKRVAAWQPDCVHITGWAWCSHLLAMREFHRRGVPTLFRGDSHLLDAGPKGPRWRVKRALLRHVYAWPSACLFVGEANREYYEAFGVQAKRLLHCPHSIDVDRFAEPAAEYEMQAAQWRSTLGIAQTQFILLFAGKFEAKKRPLELMHAVQALDRHDIVLVMVGDGELGMEVRSLAASDQDRFRVLPFQNQSRMPVVYRLGDLFVLPSAYGETWGLAVNEAMASGRAVIVSDCVGCARDVIDDSCGRVFPTENFTAMLSIVEQLFADREKLRTMGRHAAMRAFAFDIRRTDASLRRALAMIVAP